MTGATTEDDMVGEPRFHVDSLQWGENVPDFVQVLRR
jgi:hypothetical protein